MKIRKKNSYFQASRKKISPTFVTAFSIKMYFSRTYDIMIKFSIFHIVYFGLTSIYVDDNMGQDKIKIKGLLWTLVSSFKIVLILYRNNNNKISWIILNHKLNKTWNHFNIVTNNGSLLNANIWLKIFKK